MTLRRVRGRLAAEHGLSMVVAVATMAIMVMLGAVAVQQGVSALGQADRQTSVKKALQAADAGIDSAIYALNRLDLGQALNVDPLAPQTVLHQTCVVSVAGDVAGFDLVTMPADTLTDGEGRKWCSPVGETLDNGVRWEYRVSQLARVASGDCTGDGALSLDREIVAIGRSGKVTRRVRAKLRAAISLFSGAAVQSVSSTSPMTMSGTSHVLGSVRSNHSIQGTGGLPVIAGNATPGPGDPPNTVTGVVPAGAITAACQRFTLPGVAQGDASTVNSNGTWSWASATGCFSVLMLATNCKPLLAPLTGGVEWTAATRELRVWGNARLTLTGATYSFCRLRLEGQAILQIASSSPTTRIFIDDPANCHLANGNAGAGQVTADGQARFVNCHTQAHPETLQLYAVGNPTTATTQTLAGTGSLSATLLATTCGLSVPAGGTPMTIYAPRSQVDLNGSFTVTGQVAGNAVHLAGSAAVQPVTTLINLNALGANPILPLYQPTEYVECQAVSFASLPINAPASGC